MGISHPIKHKHINDGESLPHTAPMEVNLVNVPINEGFETATPTIVGNSSPTRHISTSLAMATPTNHGHITDGKSLHHTTLREGNLVSVPIICVEETKPSPRCIAEKPKKQTQEINAPHKPKPKVQDTKKRATWTNIERNTSSLYG